MWRWYGNDVWPHDHLMVRQRKEASVASASSVLVSGSQEIRREFPYCSHRTVGIRAKSSALFYVFGPIMHKSPVHTEKLNDLDQQWVQAWSLDGDFFSKPELIKIGRLYWSKY